MRTTTTTTMSTATTIVPYVGGNALERSGAWKALAEDERRRRATAAAASHDTDTLQGLADAWLTLHGRAGQKVSPQTRATYRRGVTVLLDAWAHDNLLRPGRDAATFWLRTMEAADRKPRTIQVYLAAARTLYAALRWAGATEVDPFKDVKAVKDPVDPWEKRKPYSVEDLHALLAQATGDDRVLVLLGAHAGLRVAEMLALRWADVDLGRHEVGVRHGKGGKPRTVTMSRTLAAALDAWRDESGARAPGNASRYVLPYRAPISARRRMRLLCEAAGVEPRAIHSLRHSAGTRLMEETGSLEETARHLGHANVETSRVYAKWSNKRLQATVGEW